MSAQDDSFTADSRRIGWRYNQDEGRIVPTHRELTDVQRDSEMESNRMIDPLGSAKGMWNSPHNPKNGFPYQAGRAIADKGSQAWNSFSNYALNDGAYPAFLRGGLMASLAGGGMAMAASPFMDRDRRPSILKSMLMAGLIGGGASAAIGHARSKYASYWGGGNQKADIIDSIRSAGGLSFSEKARMMQAVGGLGNQELQQLQSLLSAAGGVAVGAIVARFLLGKGKGKILAGALVGGVVGRTLFGPKQKLNALGKPTSHGRDAFGRML